MANFKGFKQVSLDYYLNQVSEAERKNYLWLVRDVDESGNTVSASIYFGNRKYADMNETSSAAVEALEEKVSSMLSSLGESIDENGDFVGFLPIENHEILGDVNIRNISDALSALESAILENKAAIEGLEDEVSDLSEMVSANTQDIAAIQDEVAANAENIQELDNAISEVKESVSSLTQDVYSKTEVDDIVDELEGKISGVWHFKGSVPSYEELPDENVEEGDVYQVGDKEYAWNGEEWVELGFTLDLSSYATKDYVDDAMADEAAAREALENKVDEIDSALTQEIQAREALEERVEVVESKATTSALTYADAEELTLENGQIVYVMNGEEGPSGHTSGAYIMTEGGLKKLESSTGDGSTISDRVEEAENNIGALETRTDELESRTDALDEIINGSDSVTGLTAEVAELQDRVDALEAENEDRISEISELDSRIEELENDNTHEITGDDVEE